MSIRMPILAAFVAALSIAATPRAATASLIVSIDSAQFSAGGGGTVDVWISSTGADTLNRFNFDLRIAPVGPTASELQFLNPQSDLQLTDANYVFSGGSLKRDGLPPIFLPAAVGTVSTANSPNDTLIGSDVSTAGNVALGSTPVLLAELDLVPGAGALAPSAGDSFTISLIAGANTVFHPDKTSATLGYSATAGTITFASPVPEPASLTLFGFGLCGLGLERLRRTRRR